MREVVQLLTSRKLKIVRRPSPHLSKVIEKPTLSSMVATARTPYIWWYATWLGPGSGAEPRRLLPDLTTAERLQAAREGGEARDEAVRRQPSPA